MARHPNDTRPFRFKQFSLFHHRSSMKVGTDAILLGVWANLESVETALDVGSGCGIISLLLAARSEAKIDALDIDAPSVEESRENFNNSGFSNRLTVSQMNFSEYAFSCEKKYDLILSNPPFFSNYKYKPKVHQRKDARHTDSLDFQQICEGVSKLLNPKGAFCVVLPQTEMPSFLSIASGFKLHLQKKMCIHPKKKQEANRLNLQLGFIKPVQVQKESLTIRENDLTFTQQFVKLLKDYYIGWD